MSGTLHDLLFGLGVATQPVNIIAGFAGVSTGPIIGVIPGLGPTQGAALLLPVVFRLAPHTGLIFLSGLYMGAIFGGSVTSILFNIPGTPMSVASAFDGYPMALKGQGSRALAGSAPSAFDVGAAGVLLGAAPGLRRAGGVGWGEHLQERHVGPLWPHHCGDWDGYDHRNAPPDVWYLRAPGRDQVPGRRGGRVWDR